MIAWVLSGGSIKGAFQVGVISALVEKGLFPDYLYGISVGSLNSTFLNHEAGLQKDARILNWTVIAQNLTRFWLNNINKPSDLVESKSYLRLAIDILRGKFSGVVSTAPLHNLVRKTISIDTLRASRLLQQVGAVDFKSGTLEYIDPTNANFIDYVLASTSIPVSMPGMIINGKPYFDGGVRDIAPLKPAIKNGSDTIIAILCQPEVLPQTNFSHTNLLQLVERVTDIMTHEIEENDISKFLDINHRLESGESLDKKVINLIIIRPDSTLEVDITSFNQVDIINMINKGYISALKTLSDT